MKDSIDNSALLREIAIVDYVANNQSEAARRNFEIAMEQDAALREAVIEEQRFRAGMQEVCSLEPVSMSNFDSLLTRVDEYEADEIELASKEEGSHVDTFTELSSDSNSLEQMDTNSLERANNVIEATPSRWTNRYSIAASIAVLAMMFGGFYSSMLAPNYDTLSSKSASAEIKFAELSEQGRLAKVVLSDKIVQSDVSEILKAYDLETFESGAPAKTFYVVANKALSAKNLENMRADSRIQQVDIFTISSHMKY